MNKAQKEVQKASLNDEKKVIRELKQVYKKASEDVEERIRQLSSRTDMENIQSIIYQKKYQEALKKQLDDVLNKLNTNQFDTISDYLNVCYETGYVGTMYDLMNQGIPMTVPINQKKVVQAIQTDTKLSSRKYKGNPLKGRLAEDIDHLKTVIRAELSRSVANGSSWNELAVKIARGMNNPFDKAYKNALLIARTEGHRVQQTAQLEACHNAKDKGADIVKQWDSTMDRKTRPAHQEADGQIRELDEPFIVWGEEMDAPAVGGSAKNVCNCRCGLLQRARWALDEEELETLKKRAEYFKLNKDDSFEEFKEKYLKLPEKADVVEVEELFESKMKVIQDRVKSQGKATEDDIHEAGKLVKDALDLENINAEAKKKFAEVEGKLQPLREKIDKYQKEIDNLTKGFEFDPWEALMNPDSLGYKGLSQDVQNKVEELRKKIDSVKNKEWENLIIESAKLKNEMSFNGKKSADYLKTTLSKIRQMGHVDSNNAVKKSSSKMRSILVNAVDYYPEPWIELILSEPLSVKKINRGYFSKWENLIAISGWDEADCFETAIHELGHCFEHKVSINDKYTSFQKSGISIRQWQKYYKDYYPEGQTFILDAEREFYKKRTEGEDLKWLGSGYAKTEKTRKDNFISPYMGKDYGGSDFELVSMGFQYAYTDPLKLAEDPDMESWIYGILALY